MIELRSPALEVDVDPGRGAEIRRLARPGRPNVLLELAAPAATAEQAPPGLERTEAGWLSAFRGGWQELFPNAGPATELDGVALPFHGEASLSAWEVVERSARAVTLRVRTRLPLVLERRMWLDGERAVLRLVERVGNRSGAPVPCLWGHHPILPAAPGTAIDLDAERVMADEAYAPAHADVPPGSVGGWPEVAGVDVSTVPEGPVQRFLCARGVRGGWAAVRPPEGDTVAFAWDAATWPVVWLWLDRGGEGFPWFGRSRALGVEPQRAWPARGLAAAVRDGSALVLAPGAEHEAWLTVAVLPPSRAPVAGVEQDGTVHLAGVAAEAR